jgi:hypothetical protein
MRRSRFHTAIAGLIIAVNCFVFSPTSLFATGQLEITGDSAADDSRPIKYFEEVFVNNGGDPLNPAHQKFIQDLDRAIDTLTINSPDANDPHTTALFTFLNWQDVTKNLYPTYKGLFDAIGLDRMVRYRALDNLTQAYWTSTHGPEIREGRPDPRPPFEFLSSQDGTTFVSYGRTQKPFDRLFVLGGAQMDQDQSKNKKGKRSELDLVVEDIINFMKIYQKQLQKLFSLGDEEAEQLANKLDDEWEAKVNALILELQNQEGIPLDETSEFVVLDAIDFTQQIKAIHRLLNPPHRLHPWLKWLLYLNRVSPEMLQFYQAALEGRDRIYTLAAKSNGKLQIRYQGRIISVPIYVWPDEAEGAYELVLVRDRTPVGSNSALPTVSAQVVQ